MPYRTPKMIQEKKDAKRRLILDTAAKVFAQRGYNITKVRGNSLYRFDLFDHHQLAPGRNSG